MKKVAIYTPTRGDTLTVTITGGSVSTAASQSYALVVSGHIDRGAWYVIIQSPNHPVLTLKQLENKAFRRELSYLMCTNCPHALRSAALPNATRFCQDPNPSRANALFTTRNCRLPCPTNPLSRNAICCVPEAGDSCEYSERSRDLTICDQSAKPVTCPTRGTPYNYR